MNFPPLPTKRQRSAGSWLDVMHVQKHWLLLARVTWIVIVVPALVLFVANVPAYFASLHSLRVPNSQGFTGQLTLMDVHTLQMWNVSLDFYAVCMVLISLLFQVIYAGVGMLLFWRKSDDYITLLASFALTMHPFGFSYITLQALPPRWSWLIPTLSILGNASLMLCAYMFPDGRLAPRGVRLLTPIMLGYWVAPVLLPSWPFNPFFSYLLFLSLIASTVIVQVYRYRYVSTSRQRQQTKWVVYGASIAIMGNLGTRLLYELVLFPHFHGSFLPAAFNVILITLSMLVIPPTLAIAILRSHLWDIDVLINRTLVYVILTTVLVLIYLGLVFTLQLLLHGVISRMNDIAIVGSTLAIAALFQPLRRSIQKGIDRRFYRSKYDAARTLEAFNAELRNEINLDQLSEQLIVVVQETMQPTHVSLWLRPTRLLHERRTRMLPRLNEKLVEH